MWSLSLRVGLHNELFITEVFHLTKETHGNSKMCKGSVWVMVFQNLLPFFSHLRGTVQNFGHFWVSVKDAWTFFSRILAILVLGDLAGIKMLNASAENRHLMLLISWYLLFDLCTKVLIPMLRPISGVTSLESPSFWGYVYELQVLYKLHSRASNMNT